GVPDHLQKWQFYLSRNCSSYPYIPYVNSDSSPTTPPTAQPEKPILLLWVWPENYRWDFSDCKTFYNIDGCHLTDDRSLYNQADAVLIYHRDIKWDLSNLPPSPRPPFQRWIWLHAESPTNNKRIPGLENLFNLTLSYRRNADISVRNLLTISKTPNKKFELPKKDKLVCWFVSNIDPSTGTGTRMKYYEELSEHIKVNVGWIACRFYLSFENSIHKDYITEERLPNASVLAQYLLQLDKDDEAYRRYFAWGKHVSATPHLVIVNQECRCFRTE
uniref:Fucosyltransferase n=1 Tax=Pygocentrus nattereri TaxID=42514 RepID=A0A3B4E1K0_PYGNA